MSYIIAADTGGTFTDLAVYDRSRQQLIYQKSLTTYDNLVNGVMDCLHKAAIDLSKAELIKFGTTLVINTFVQRNGARTALVTTRGFRDALEIRRGNRPIPFDLRYKRDPVLVERDLRFEADERVGAEGNVVRALDPAEIVTLARALRALEVEAVAVSFINSYVNSAHEEEAARLLRDELPGVYITAGTGLSREWYEYERSSTAVANAYVGPRMQDYVKRLDGQLRAEGLARPFFLMASNGGVFSLPRAQEQPVMLVESGPVGGCIGTGVYASELGIGKAIAFDMGGTTAKSAVLESGQFELKSPYYVGGLERGFPVRGHVLDIVEVGTGGGSVAWTDPHGRLCVGPRSAGSDPGPVCYLRGGSEPTITDANLVLGRIGAASFLGGEMTLGGEAAKAAVAAHAARLGFRGPQANDEMAHGILLLGTMTMASAIRQITIERGLDPREFVLFAFGGGGPLHAATLARELAIPEVIVPPEPGIFSALGMLLADARIDRTQTYLRPLGAEAVRDMSGMFAAMETSMGEELANEIGVRAISFERRAEMRFHGQRHTMLTPIGTAGDEAAVRAAFETTYRQRYGRVETSSPIEYVSLVVTAFARMDRPDLAHFRPRGGGPVDVSPRSRSVYFAEAAGRLDTLILQRSALPVGYAGSGPAIIEEYGSTTVVGPLDRFSVGRLGEIHITFPAAA